LLTAKQAVFKSKNELEYTDLSKRIRALFFLATPQKGADSIQMLDNIRHASASMNSVSGALDSQSETDSIQSINDDFRRCCGGIQLWSFYETLDTVLGNTKAVIIDKKSATSGMLT
jgi:hypothetical protein